jgi:D-lactate dehydrogenase (cytochrome)
MALGMSDNAATAGVLQRAAAIVGNTHLLTTAADLAPYVVDWRKRYVGNPLAVAKPATAAETAALVKLCAETHTPIVPQGGNTSLCGASVPDGAGTALVINLSRLSRIRQLDPVNNTITVEAGCVLAAIQQAAQAADRLFPLSLASEGSCEIGGNLSTNAGGVQVLRYGNTRELVLGLEVVLPSGELWEGLRGLRKDNTGYDLKQLFIGAEGTLGIITAAVLKLFPRPRGIAVALAGLDSVERVLQLLAFAQSRAGERLSAFELMSEFAMKLVLKHCPGTQKPFDGDYPQYALLELSDTQSAGVVTPLLESLLADAMEQGIIIDGVIAQSESQAGALWALRENVSEAQGVESKNLKHDISVPISAIGDFVRVTDAALESAYPGARPVTFGHVGDGNLHYNIAHSLSSNEQAWLGEMKAVQRIVHDSVARFNGSISAEHGLGQTKRDEVLRYKSAIEMDLMRSIKQALDPLGIMNPGKVL